ncbi:MAG: CAP domain-containing protein [Chitinophagaceae bacterium]|nr:CAP domain-containing protein [Chitinophagaceae bacterium]
MKQSIFYLFITLFLVSFKTDSRVYLDKSEAKEAFEFLNDIRTNPGRYAKELRLNKNAKTSTTKLVWNKDLAKAAEAKAYDMASRNYFNHIDPNGYGMNYYIQKNGYSLEPAWTNSKRNNFFESIAAGVNSGEEAIRLLIIDKGVPSLGHRKHLLGIGSFNASLTDIGIGFARRNSGSNYTTYISIIIAKHN